MHRHDPSAFLVGSPFARLTWLGLAVALGAFALGCTPKIGDGCALSTNCSAAGDRLCDTTQPGGYCTVFNCDPGTCPADSVCINFGTTLAGSSACAPSQGNSPYQRSFCMASCGSDGDCRSGYSCLNLKGPDQDGHESSHESTLLGAVLAEHSGDGKVCGIMPKDPGGAGAPSTEVCTGPDAGTPTSGSGGAATGGATGTGDAGLGGAGG